MIKAIIVEDEKKSLLHLKNLLQKHVSGVTIIGDACNAVAAIELITNTQPDLIFLDIQLPDQTGIDMLVSLGNHNCEVIITSAFDNYGIQAIKLSALDYLLKPVQSADLIKAVQRVRVHQEQKFTGLKMKHLLETLTGSFDEIKRIALPMQNEIRFVNPKEIIRCEGHNNYTRFYLHTGEVLLVSKGLHYYFDILQPVGFIRCHQSHAVNKDYIQSLAKENTISELVLTNKTRIPVSRLKIEEVKQALYGRKTRR